MSLMSFDSLKYTCTICTKLYEKQSKKNHIIYLFIYLRISFCLGRALQCAAERYFAHWHVFNHLYHLTSPHSCGTLKQQIIQNQIKPQQKKYIFVCFKERRRC